MELEEYRSEIDAFDKKLVYLLEQRMDIVAHIAAFKEAHHMEICDPQREFIVLDKIDALATNKQLVPHLRKIYQCIMEESKKYEGKQMGR